MLYELSCWKREEDGSLGMQDKRVKKEGSHPYEQQAIVHPE